MPVIDAIRGVATWVHGILPKVDDAVLWGWPDHEDSILALEHALQDTAVRRVVVLMTDPRSVPPVPRGPKTVAYAKRSVRGVVAFAFARYVFFTHRCYLKRFSDRVVAVNVWHGMPVKRIGWMLEGDDGIASQHVIATSPLWADIMDRAMRPTGTVLTTGIPRNDRLFGGRTPVWRTLGLDGRDDVTSIVVWLPTYRHSVRGMATTDGSGTDSPFGMDGVDIDALDRALGALGMVAVVKPHPLARPADVREYDNLHVADDAWLNDRGLSLYDLVGAADVLVTDFSSVVVDYVLLDRPIVHAIADLDDYTTSRGFSVQRVADHLAGPVAETPDAVVEALTVVATGADPAAARRRALRDLWHEHVDGNATERLLDAVGLGTGGGTP